MRVVRVDAQVASVVLPAWDSDQLIELPLANIPSTLHKNFSRGFRCHAHVNIGAERKEDLVFRDWES